MRADNARKRQARLGGLFLWGFWNLHPEAEKPLRNWLTICQTKDFENFAQLKQTFRTVDKVGKFVVFDIGGNKFGPFSHMRSTTRTSGRTSEIDGDN